MGCFLAETMSIGVMPTKSTNPQHAPKAAINALSVVPAHPRVHRPRIRPSRDVNNYKTPAGTLLSCLNGDVLHEIASYLRGRDALNLALTARRVHDFAVHRVGAHLVCRTPSDLRILHYHLLKGHPARAVFLRSLSIYGSTFVDRPWQEDPNWAFPETTYEYSLASLLADVLHAAPSLNHLLLEHVGPLVYHEPRIGTVIASMTRLCSLELGQVDLSCLPIFQDLRSRPHHLRLSAVKTGAPSEARRLLQLIHDVLAAVSSIKELTVLDLDLSQISCQPFNLSFEPGLKTVVLPHVRRLSVQWLSLLLDLGTLFPNLDSLEQHVSSFQVQRSSKTPLRCLSITELRTQSATTQPVHLLHLRKYPRDLQSFLCTVGETSPVGLSLHSFIDAPQWISYWDQLPRIAPRLKFMDVHCHTWERSPKAGWVTRFLDSLRGYSLVCLRIIAPQPPAAGSDNTRWDEEDVQALAELPDRLLQVMPTLRYVAWAAKRSTAGEYVWYEDGYDPACAEYKWYRAVDDGAGDRKLKGITPSDGERVRRFLLDADLDAITNIDSNLILEAVSEPPVIHY